MSEPNQTRPESDARHASESFRRMSSSLSQDSGFSVLKDAGKAQEQLAQIQAASDKNMHQTSDGYLDQSGNFKIISPAHNVNPNQFYASVDSHSKEQLEQLLSDSWGPGVQPQRTGSLSTTKLDIIEEASPTSEVAQVGQVPSMRSGSSHDSPGGESLPVVPYEPPPPPYSALPNDPGLLEDGSRQTTTASDFGSTSDSISLPATTPPASRQNEDVFSTAVDEETLEAAKRRHKKSKSLFQTEDWEKVKPVQLTMTQVIDSRADHHFQHSMQHMKAMYYEKAINCLNKAVNLKSSEVEFYIQRAECYIQLCDYQSAILNYKRACVLNPDNFTHYSRLAFIYYFQGQCLFDQRLFPEALEAFSRAAEMRPEVIGYHTRSIACLAALQRHGECLALVNKRLEAEDQNADLYVMRARLHELFRNTTLCYYDVKDALTLDPGHREAMALMTKLEMKGQDLKQQAMHLNLLSRHRDALQKITLAIETNPAIAEYHVLRGALNRRLGDFNAAIDDYLLALDKTDHNEESEVYLEAQRQLLLTYNDFAVECFTKGFYEEAIILLNKAIKGEKREKGLYINRGDCFFRQGHLQFSLADYHQALEMDPDDESVRARIAIVHNEHGIEEYTDKNHQEAEARFTLAIQHCPKVGQYYISRARARQVMDNITGARQDVVMALHLDPSNDEILGILSRLFPGKSVKDVLNSRAAAAARTALQNLVVTASPVKLAPLDGPQSSRSGGEDEMDGSQLNDTISSKASSKYGDLRQCMNEKDFQIKIALEKQHISERVKEALQERKTLSYSGGRVGPLPDPVTRTKRSKNPLDKEVLALDKPKGWRKFTLGVGIQAVPDNV